jgi:hypothetical protein
VGLESVPVAVDLCFQVFGGFGLVPVEPGHIGGAGGLPLGGGLADFKAAVLCHNRVAPSGCEGGVSFAACRPLLSPLCVNKLTLSRS